MVYVTEAIRVRASEYSSVDEGTTCTQSCFKTGGKAFLFIGEQGERYSVNSGQKNSLRRSIG